MNGFSSINSIDLTKDGDLERNTLFTSFLSKTSTSCLVDLTSPVKVTSYDNKVSEAIECMNMELPNSSDESNDESLEILNHFPGKRKQIVSPNRSYSENDSTGPGLTSISEHKIALQSRKKERSIQKRRITSYQMEIEVVLEKSLSNSNLGYAIHNGISSTFKNLSEFECDIKNCMKWRYRVLGEKTYANVPYFAILMPGKKFISRLCSEEYEAYKSDLEIVRNEIGINQCRGVLIVENVEKYLRMKVKETKIFREKMEDTCIRLQSDDFCQTIFTKDRLDTVSTVLAITQELAKVPYCENGNFLEFVPRLNSIRTSPVGGICEETTAWLRMLQMIPGVSEAKANRIVNHYPSVDCLLSVYCDNKKSEEHKEQLLSSILSVKNSEIILSKRIYSVFST